MFLGEFRKDEKVPVVVATHKFETGGQFNGVVAGYYVKKADILGDRVPIVFTLMEDEIGIYLSDIDISGLSGGIYLIVIKATIDTVIAQTVDYFSIKIKDAVIGIAKIGYDDIG